MQDIALQLALFFMVIYWVSTLLVTSGGASAPRASGVQWHLWAFGAYIFFLILYGFLYMVNS